MSTATPEIDNDALLELLAMLSISPLAGSGHQPQMHRSAGYEWQRIGKLINTYLLNFEEFRRLSELREQGWKNPDADAWFQNQRDKADNADEKLSEIFYNVMKQIGQEMQDKTGALAITKQGTTTPQILDMCCAPGGFLATTMGINKDAHALGLSLPEDQGGHKIRLPPHPNLELKFLDLTMLAADMGVTNIPKDHPDAKNFLPRQLPKGKLFDLVMCDGQVLRPNVHNRAAYRSKREGSRLVATQLALGLEHLQPGGTIVILLYRVEAPENICWLYRFSKFSSVQLFKPVKYHAKRSSFYMVATNVQSRHPEAILAIQAWKKHWKVATFGSNDEYEECAREHWADTETVLWWFRRELVKMGKEIWSIQAEALSRAPFVKKLKKS